MDEPAANDRGDRTDGKKLIGRDGQVVAVEHHEIGQLAGRQGSKRILPKGQVGVGVGGAISACSRATGVLLTRRPLGIVPVAAQASVMKGLT